MRCLLLTLPLLLLSVAAVAQQTGTLTVTVQQVAEPGLPATPAPAVGAKVIVVHWANKGPNPSLVHDQIATTNQMGTCTLTLPAGTYDVLVAASELAPAAFRREIKAGATTSVTAHLRPAPQHLQPVQ